MIKRGALLGQARCPGQRPASRCRRGVGKAGDSNREGDVRPRQPAAQGPTGKYVTPLGPSRVPAAEPPTLPTQRRPWRPLCAVQTGAPRLAGDARGAPAPGKLLALCWCHWPHLLVPHRTPSRSQPHSTLRAGRMWPPRAPRALTLGTGSRGGQLQLGTQRQDAHQQDADSPHGAPSLRVPVGWRGSAGVYIRAGPGRGRTHNRNSRCVSQLCPRQRQPHELLLPEKSFTTAPSQPPQPGCSRGGDGSTRQHPAPGKGRRGHVPPRGAPRKGLELPGLGKRGQRGQGKGGAPRAALRAQELGAPGGISPADAQHCPGVTSNDTSLWGRTPVGTGQEDALGGGGCPGDAAR